MDCFFVAGILFLNVTAFVISRSNSFNNLENYYIEEGIEYNRDDIIERFKTDVSWKFTDWEATVVLVMLLGYIVGGILGYIAAHFSIKVNRSKA